MSTVLHIVPLKRRAGLQVMFINYLNYLKEHNPNELENHIVLLMNYSNELIDEIENIGVKYYKAKRLYKLDFKVLLQIRKIIINHNVDVIYGQNSTGNFWSVLANIISPKTTLICHEHGTAWNTSTKISQWSTKLWIKKADTIIANSEAAKSLLIKKHKAEEKKIKVILNGVPIKDLNMKVKKKNNQLLFVGRLDKVKSPDTLLLAVYHLKELGFNYNAVFLGEGYLLEKLKLLAKKYEINHLVEFKGNVDSISVTKYMAESSLLILPSIREPLGNVIIESAMQKTAIIGTMVDGIPEVVKDKRYGRLIIPKKTIYNTKGLPQNVINPLSQTLCKPKKLDPKKLAEVIIDELSDNSYITKGEFCFNNIPNNHSMEAYIKNINYIIMK